MFVPFAVVLTSDTQYAIIGSLVNLTCAANGTPPLTIEFKNDNMESIDENAIIQHESASVMCTRVLSFLVKDTGPMRFTCIVTNLTGHQANSTVEVTGVGKLVIALVNDNNCLRLGRARFTNRQGSFFKD